MKKLIVSALAAALTVAAMPAMAGDLLYEAAPDSLTEALNGRPVWSAQAECAGLFGAASQYLTDKGDSAAADEAGKLAVSFANDAITRLGKDRGLTRKQALAVIEPAVIRARDAGAELVSRRGDGVNSTWNFARSSCLDVAEAYTQVSN